MAIRPIAPDDADRLVMPEHDAIRSATDDRRFGAGTTPAARNDRERAARSLGTDDDRTKSPKARPSDLTHRIQTTSSTPIHPKQPTATHPRKHHSKLSKTNSRRPPPVEMGPRSSHADWRGLSTPQVREPRTTRPGSSERAPNWPNRRTQPNEPKRHTRPNTLRQNRHPQRNCHTTNQPLPAIDYKSDTTSTLRKNRVRGERLAAYTPTSYSRRNHEIRSLYRAYLF